ncbi:MAG TPA: hypothetical protein VM899_06215 [Rubellimicrobium sp.]|nr:hypothetical protein [Rubellimicrobium sp.]
MGSLDHHGFRANTIQTCHALGQAQEGPSHRLKLVLFRFSPGLGCACAHQMQHVHPPERVEPSPALRLGRVSMGRDLMTKRRQQPGHQIHSGDLWPAGFAAL